MAVLPRPILTWPEKDPDDLLDYALDFGPQFGDGDQVVATEFVADGLTIHAQLADGNLAVVWLAGGLSGSRYLVSCTARSAQGRMVRLAAELPVRKHKAL